VELLFDELPHAPTNTDSTASATTKMRLLIMSNPPIGGGPRRNTRVIRSRLPYVKERRNSTGAESTSSKPVDQPFFGISRR
jgi:hypothetical protein